QAGKGKSMSVVSVVLHKKRKPTEFVTLIDECDADAVLQWRWALGEPPGSRTKYARSSHKAIYLHRFIMRREIERATEKVEVDHIEGNGLKNRRANLRLVSHSANIAAAHKWKRFNRRPGTHINTIKAKLATGEVRTYRYNRRTGERLPE